MVPVGTTVATTLAAAPAHVPVSAMETAVLTTTVKHKCFKLKH